MQPTERHAPKPVRDAERRAATAERRAATLEARARNAQAAQRRAETAERRAATAEAEAARERTTVARLTADLAEAREDRDRWRAQAERLAAALERLREGSRPSTSSAETSNPSEEGGILHGFEAIGVHMGISSDAARGRAAKERMPFVRDGRRVWIRRATLDAWLASREAAAAGGR